MGFFESTEQENVKQAQNSLWVERYRPRKLDEYIGNEYLKDRIATFLEDGDIPHLLFYGRAGVGKSTVSKMIANTIECDYMIINASDENNVETVRTKIKGFASTVGFKEKKIMILDEADYLSPQAQGIMRNLMETFSDNCRFILTCNYVERVIEPIQSRCQSFEVIPPSKKEVALHVSNILKKEEIEYNAKDLVPIIDSSYPDIRKIINNVQLASSKGKLKVDKQKILNSDYKMKMLEVLQSDNTPRNKYREIRQVIANSRTQDFTDAYTFLYQKVDDFAGENTSVVILALADGQQQDALVIDKEIQFAATIIRILELI